MSARSRRSKRSAQNSVERLPFGASGPCGQLSTCQSCPLLPLPLEAQLAHKRDALVAALEYAELPNGESISLHIDSSAGTTGRDSGSSADPTLGYRRTAKPAVRHAARGDEIEIGLYKPGSHALVDLGDCWVQSPLINQLLRALKQLAPKYGIPGYLEGDELHEERASLRYVVARHGDRIRALGHASAEAELTEREDALYLTLILTRAPMDKGQLTTLAVELAHACPRLIGVGLHINTSSGNAIFDAKSPTLHLWGEDALETRVQLRPELPPISLRVSSTSFAQVNPEVAERAYRAIVEGLAPRPGDRVIDLYCGVGVIGLCLAWSARHHSDVGCGEEGGEERALAALWGLEETPSSIRDARLNAQRLSIREARFLEGRAEDELGLLVEQLSIPSEGSSDQRGVDLVALNPSRRGCQSIVLEQIAALHPRKIAYMSCHARTLARDLKRLTHHGYQPTQITLFDMFPGSPHYETVTLLEPRGSQR